LFYNWSQTQGVYIIEEASQLESDGREDVEAPIMRDPVPEWERRILCTVERPRAAQISEKMQSA
jgi:hypothetical protein